MVTDTERKPAPLTMRPFGVVFGLLLTSTVACGLVGVEGLPRRESDDTTNIVDEPLRGITFTASLRRENFAAMGLEREDAEEAAEMAVALFNLKGKGFEEMLDTQAAEVSDAFCPEPSRLPTPYGAMEWLVEENSGVRGVVTGERLLELDKQPWFAIQNSARPVYDALEARKDRALNASVMGIAALIAKRETEALDRSGPWSRSRWAAGSFSSLVADDLALRQKTLRYLALMHVLTEIARKPDGICQSDRL